MVELSWDCGDRPAGRKRWQYSGAHRCEPPLRAWMIVGSGSGGIGQQELLGASGVCPRSEYRVVVHYQTLPIMSIRPNPFAGKVPTGEVPIQRWLSNPSAPSLRYGKRPCHVLAISCPSTRGSSPHA